MELKGRDSVRNKTVVDNKITEKVNCFNYLEYWYLMKKKCILKTNRITFWK